MAQTEREDELFACELKHMLIEQVLQPRLYMEVDQYTQKKRYLFEYKHNDERFRLPFEEQDIRRDSVQD